MAVEPATEPAAEKGGTGTPGGDPAGTPRADSTDTSGADSTDTSGADPADNPAEASAACCGLATSPVTADHASTLAAMFKALGDPVRLQMVSMIASRPEVCVCDISPAFELSSGTISHHLKALREAGLITGQRRGTFVYYRVVPQALRSLGALLSVDQP